MAKQRPGSPSVNVRFVKTELDRIKAEADRRYQGNVSMLIKVAVERFLQQPEKEAA